MIQALSPPPTVIVLVHRGRKSGRLYKTPLSILVEDPERGEIFVSPMWSRDSDWYRNVIAGGLVEIHVRGEKRQVEWRELDEAEGRAAGEAFRDAHPIYSRMTLRMIARLNRFEGDPSLPTSRETLMRRQDAYALVIANGGCVDADRRGDLSDGESCVHFVPLDLNLGSGFRVARQPTKEVSIDDGNTHRLHPDRR